MTEKRRRGRPRKIENIFAVADVVTTHERLRLSGLGRNEAIKRTVEEVMASHPDYRLSATAVKNILAEWQPENLMLYEVGSPGNWKMGVFRFEKQGNCYSLKFGERPPFPKRGTQTARKKITYGRKKA